MYIRYIITLVIVNEYIQSTIGRQQCGSCSAVSEQRSCQHYVTCSDFERCYVKYYETETGTSLYDLGCITSTVFQRRIDGTVDFYRDWRDYKSGFGSANGEYWLGLENIHVLTSLPNYELKVVMTDFENVTKHARYLSFHIEDASKYYRLTVYGYSGTAGDSLKRQSGMMFSTFDADHDTVLYNCAVVYHGGWWYERCHDSNLNGKYLHGSHTTFADGIEWQAWHGYYYSLKSSIVMIRKT